MGWQVEYYRRHVQTCTDSEVTVDFEKFIIGFCLVFVVMARRYLNRPRPLSRDSLVGAEYEAVNEKEKFIRAWCFISSKKCMLHLYPLEFGFGSTIHPFEIL
jgi:hypothetical protein